MRDQYLIRQIKGRDSGGYAQCYYCDDVGVSMPIYSVRPLELRHDGYGRTFRWPGARIDVLAVCRQCAYRAADGEYAAP